MLETKDLNISITIYILNEAMPITDSSAGWIGDTSLEF